MKNNNIEVKIDIDELEHLMALSTGLAVRLRDNTMPINLFRDYLRDFNCLILDYIEGKLTYSYVYAEWIELEDSFLNN